MPDRLDAPPVEVDAEAMALSVERIGTPKWEEWAAAFRTLGRQLAEARRGRDDALHTYRNVTETDEYQLVRSERDRLRHALAAQDAAVLQEPVDFWTGEAYVTARMEMDEAKQRAAQRQDGGGEGAE